MRAPRSLHRSGNVAVLTAVLLSAWLGSGEGSVVAQAQEAASSTQLLIHVAASADVAASLNERLGPLLARRHVDLQVAVVSAVDLEHVLQTASQEPEPRVLARVWLDGRAHDAAVLLLVPRHADHVLVRRIELRAGFDDVVLAELDFVLDRAVASLLGSRPVGVPIAEARVALAETLARSPPTVVTAVGAASPSTHFAVDLSAFVGGAAVMTGWTATPIVGGSIGLVRRDSRLQLGLRLDGQLREGVSLQTADANVSIGGGMTHLSLQAGRPVGRLGVVSALLGAGVAVTSVHPSPRVPASGFVSVAARRDVDLAFLMAVQWNVPVGYAFGVFLHVAADIVPTSERYTALVDSTQSVVLTPPLVRPTFLAGLTYTFGG
jgi:hypothetical protein